MNQAFHNLLRKSDLTWYWYLFSKDPLFRKVDHEKIDELIVRAVACGKAEATRLINEYKTNDVSRLYDWMEIAIEESEDPGSFGIYYLSIYQPDKGVQVFINRVQMVEDVITANLGDSSLMPDMVKRLLLTHELYHVCEDRNPDLFTENYELVLWRLGPFSYKSKISALSEIGATAFTKELCGVNFNPLILNYALLYSVAPHSAKELYKRVDRFSMKVAD